MNPRVKTVKPTDDYQLLLQFTDGKQGLYDCRQLQDKHYFKQVFVNDGTVNWPNEQDILP